MSRTHTNVRPAIDALLLSSSFAVAGGSVRCRAGNIPIRYFRPAPFSQGSCRHFGTLQSCQTRLRRKSNSQFRDAWRCGSEGRAEFLSQAELGAPSTNFRIDGIFEKSETEKFLKISRMAKITKFFKFGTLS